MSETNFWDITGEKFTPDIIDMKKYEKTLGPFLAQINLTIKNRKAIKILDLGCGTGELSVYLAKKGFCITGIDNSIKSIENAKKLAKINNCSKLARFYCLDAFEIAKLNGKYDLIIGTYILHHLEPFEKFAVLLAQRLTKSGVGLFYENSANNMLLMLCRRYLAGKFGIPKYGDSEESPFSQTEINCLKKYFDINQIWHDFIFFRKLSTYIFRNDSKLNLSLQIFFEKADIFNFKYLKIMRRFIYNQIIFLKRK